MKVTRRFGFIPLLLLLVNLISSSRAVHVHFNEGKEMCLMEELTEAENAFGKFVRRGEPDLA
jgi:hypothetical protein